MCLVGVPGTGCAAGCELPFVLPVSQSAPYANRQKGPHRSVCRYLAAWRELGWRTGVVASRKAATERTLAKVSRGFHTGGGAGEDEKRYYCSACKSHQLANIKKLQIWRLPPILIILAEVPVSTLLVKSHRFGPPSPTTDLSASTWRPCPPLPSGGSRSSSTGLPSRPARSRTADRRPLVTVPIVESSEPNSLCPDRKSGEPRSHDQTAQHRQWARRGGRQVHCL